MSNIPPFSIKVLFSCSEHYVIPIYQRNYTWGQGEIKQLIQDIYDYAFDHQPIQPYYIGSLIVFMPIIMRLSRNIWINFFVDYDKNYHNIKVKS